MSRLTKTEALKSIQGLFQHGNGAELSDAELLCRFADRTGKTAELAFAALVERHGSMVLRVCRRVLTDPNDADDAFQETFLVLLRQAGAVRRRASVASWLHGVAYRVASAARSDRSRRHVIERKTAASTMDHADDPLCRDEQERLLHDEITQLPARFRDVVVLCGLEGYTYEHAAQQLGCPVGTIKSRLAAAREILRSRLTRRGLAPAAVLPLLTLAAEPSGAAVPRALAAATIRGTMQLVTARPASGGLVSLVVAILTKGVQTVGLTSMKASAVFLVLAATAGIGTLAGRPVVLGDQPPAASENASTTTIPPKKPTLTQRLNSTVSVDFENEPLGTALKELEKQSGLRFVLDPGALRGRGLTLSTPVSLVARGISTKSALKLILQPLGFRLMAMEDGESLLVTAPNRAPMNLVEYDVGDLLATASHEVSTKRGSTDMSPLIDLLTSIVAPTTWKIETEPNEIEGSGPQFRSFGLVAPSRDGKCLLIRHTDDVHEQIRLRLRQLRRLNGLSAGPGTAWSDSPKAPRRAIDSTQAQQAKVDDADFGRKVLVRFLIGADTPRITARHLKDQIIKGIEDGTQHRVVSNKEDADLILDCSLRPRSSSPQQVKP